MIAPREFGETGESCRQIDFHTIDGIFIKTLCFAKAGDVMLQHKHTYSHGHFVAAGSVALFVEGELQGYYHAPELVHIEAGKFHQIVAMEDGTVGLCIHNLHGNPELSIDEEATYQKVA